MAKLPFMKWYPTAWLSDQAVRACSHQARALWIDMLCIMHDATPYGHLVLGGAPMNNDALARVSGLDAGTCGELLAELESMGVFSRTRKGIIYSRRMTRDRKRSEDGRKNVGLRADRAHSEAPENEGKKPPTNSNATSKAGRSASTLEVRGKNKKIPKKDAGEIGQPDGVSDAVWRDFVTLRHRKDAPITETAMTGIRREAEKAGWTLESALAECVTRGWQGFKAEWVNKTGGSWSSNTPTASTGTDDFIRRMEAFEAKQKEAVKP